MEARGSKRTSLKASAEVLLEVSIGSIFIEAAVEASVEASARVLPRKKASMQAPVEAEEAMEACRHGLSAELRNSRWKFTEANGKKNCYAEASLGASDACYGRSGPCFVLTVVPETIFARKV